MTHLGYVLSAYAVTAGVLGGVAIWIVWSRRQQLRALHEIDARRVPNRRSGTKRSEC